MSKYNEELPSEIEAQLDSYMDRIKAIKWFQPSKNMQKDDIEKQVSVAIEAFGCKASIELRSLRTPKARIAVRDEARIAAWDEAWDALRDEVRDEARIAVRDAAWSAARDALWDEAWGASWGEVRIAAWDAAWGAVDLLAMNLPEYKSKYPQGNFINLIPLYEAGLYPVGIVDGKFLVYVPPCNMEFPDEF